MQQSLKSFLDTYGRWLGFAALAVLVLLALFLFAKTLDAFDRIGKSPYTGPNVITVTGTGKAEAPPTIARVVFTVQENADTVAQAQDQAASRTRATLDAIRELGVADEDVQAANYQTNPRYEYPQPCVPGGVCPPRSEPRIIGYQVSQTVTVKIRNTDMAGEVLQALGTVGVQNISGPNFEVDDDSAVMAEARGKAIEDARKQAKELAKQLGVRLGDVMSFSEYGGPTPYYGMGGGMMDMAVRSEAAAVPPLPQGQEESVVNVTITYEIK